MTSWKATQQTLAPFRGLERYCDPSCPHDVKEVCYHLSLKKSKSRGDLIQNRLDQARLRDFCGEPEVAICDEALDFPVQRRGASSRVSRETIGAP